MVRGGRRLPLEPPARLAAIVGSRERRVGGARLRREARRLDGAHDGADARASVVLDPRALGHQADGGDLDAVDREDGALSGEREGVCGCVFVCVRVFWKQAKEEVGNFFFFLVVFLFWFVCGFPPVLFPFRAVSFWQKNIIF